MAVVGQWNYYDLLAADGVKWRVWGRPRRELGKSSWEIEWHPEVQPTGFPKRIDDPSPAGPDKLAKKPEIDMSNAKEGVRSNLPDAEMVDLLTPPGGTPPEVIPPETVTAVTATGSSTGSFLGWINSFKQPKRADAEAPTAAGLLILIGVGLLITWAIRSARGK